MKHQFIAIGVVAALCALAPAASTAAPSRAMRVTGAKSGGTGAAITFDSKDRP